jgi:hypothetical protein
VANYSASCLPSAVPPNSSLPGRSRHSPTPARGTRSRGPSRSGGPQRTTRLPSPSRESKQAAASCRHGPASFSASVTSGWPSQLGTSWPRPQSATHVTRPFPFSRRQPRLPRCAPIPRLCAAPPSEWLGPPEGPSHRTRGCRR